MRVGSSTSPPRQACSASRASWPMAPTKEAIRGMTKIAAKEWGQYGICVNVVLPGAESPAAKAWAQKFPEEYAKQVNLSPMKRFWRPGERHCPCGRISGRAGLLLLFRPERDRRRCQLHHALSPTINHNTAGENWFPPAAFCPEPPGTPSRRQCHARAFTAKQRLRQGQTRPCLSRILITFLYCVKTQSLAFPRQRIRRCCPRHIRCAWRPERS